MRVIITKRFIWCGQRQISKMEMNGNAKKKSVGSKFDLFVNVRVPGEKKIRPNMLRICFFDGSTDFCGGSEFDCEGLWPCVSDDRGRNLFLDK